MGEDRENIPKQLGAFNERLTMTCNREGGGKREGGGGYSLLGDLTTWEFDEEASVGSFLRPVPNEYPGSVATGPGLLQR